MLFTLFCVVCAAEGMDTFFGFALVAAIAAKYLLYNA